MAVEYDKIIRVPLKREAPGVALCPEEDRCQLEVVQPDKTQAIDIVTANDGSLLVRVGIIKAGSGCDYKVRVGMLADRDGDFLYIRMGNTTVGYFFTVFDVAGRRTVDPQTVELLPGSPVAPATLPAVNSSANLAWFDYNFERSTPPGEVTYTGGVAFSNSADDTQLTQTGDFSLPDGPLGSDPFTYTSRAEKANALTSEVVYRSDFTLTMGGKFTSGTSWASYASGSETTEQTGHTPNDTANGTYCGYTLTDSTQYPGRTERFLFSMTAKKNISSLFTKNSSTYQTHWLTTKETGSTITAIHTPAGTEEVLVDVSATIYAEVTSGVDPTLQGVLVGLDPSTAASGGHVPYLWQFMEDMGTFGCYGFGGGFNRYILSDNDPTSVELFASDSSSAGPGIDILFTDNGAAAESVEYGAYISKAALFTTLEVEVASGQVSVFDMISNNNTAIAAAMRNSVDELAVFVRSYGTAAKNSLNEGISRFRAYVKKTPTVEE